MFQGGISYLAAERHLKDSPLDLSTPGRESEGGQFLKTISLVWRDSRFISNTNALLSEPKITDTNLSTEPVGNSNLYELGSAKPATF